jgi:hypothetical protein
MNAVKGILSRKIINDPTLQYGVTAFFSALVIINVAFFSIIFKMLESKLLNEINQLDESQKKYFLAIFNDLSQVAFYSILGFGAFMIIFSIFGGILLLQHISGPSYAIKKFLTDLQGNEKPRYPLKFRRHDFFNEHAELLNKVYEKYEMNKKN